MSLGKEGKVWIRVPVIMRKLKKDESEYLH